MLTSSPMKLLLTLDNDEKVLINWGVIFESTDPNDDRRPIYCGFVAYAYQLPLTHKLFEYYRKVDTSSKYHEVVEELYKRRVSYISIHVHQTIDLNEDAFESLNKCGYVHSTFMKKSLVGSPVVVSHTLVDGTVMDNCETLNRALQEMYEHYVELQLFRDLESEYNEDTFVDIIKAEKIKE